MKRENEKKFTLLRDARTLLPFCALLTLLCLALASTHLPPRAIAAQEKLNAESTTGTEITSLPAPTPKPSPDSDEEEMQDDVLRVETDLVNVLFTAIDKERRFITTLRREDIRVLEDNKPQEIAFFQRETDLPLSLAILIDVSRSQERTLPDEKTAGIAFIDTVLRPEKDQVSVISFMGEAKVEQFLTNDLNKLRSAINRVKVDRAPDNFDCNNDKAQIPPNKDPRCMTNVWDAIWATVDKVLSQTSERTRRAIILLSDGDDTNSKMKRQEAIDFALKFNTVIYSIGIGDEERYHLEKKALRDLSEKTGGRVFFPEDEEDLAQAFAQIQQELRSQYLVAYSPLNKKRDGTFRQVEVEIINKALTKQKLQLLYRPGYYARKN